jgi:8-oxo-dGTP diphosphatase
MSAEGMALFSRWGFRRNPRPDRHEPALKVRVSVVLLRGGKILLIRHRRDARFYWVLPGGGLETGETLVAAAAREVREEAGLHVEILRPLYLAEVLWPSGKKHVLNLIFLGAQAESDQQVQPSRQWQIEEPHFLPLEDLASIDLYPPIAGEILEDAAAGWQTPIRFLGNRWRDMEELPAWRVRE